MYSNRHRIKKLAKRELSRVSKNVNYFLVDTSVFKCKTNQT